MSPHLWNDPLTSLTPYGEVVVRRHRGHPSPSTIYSCLHSRRHLRGDDLPGWVKGAPENIYPLNRQELNRCSNNSAPESVRSDSDDAMGDESGKPMSKQASKRKGMLWKDVLPE